MFYSKICLFHELLPLHQTSLSSRQYDIAKSSYYKLRSKYQGMDTSDLQRLKELHVLSGNKVRKIYSIGRSIYRYQPKKQAADTKIKKVLTGLAKVHHKLGFLQNDG
ncbi:hypothetical protein [Piscirickettsia salmonis]|uniref:hypothetical protein n=1 Tax=Piscirickettsia salmonis TaxID=1238 RepID=UPI003A7FDAE7